MLDLWGTPNQSAGAARPVVINTTIAGGDVDYWYQEAQRLRKDYATLLECNDNNFRNALEFKASDAALRAVLRTVLNQLTAADPRNPLLQKDIRDSFFAIHRKAAIESLLKSKNEKEWAPQNPKHAISTDEVDEIARTK